MIICTNCDVIVAKNTFCTPKCRTQHHRRDVSVTTEAKKLEIDPRIVKRLQAEIDKATDKAITEAQNEFGIGEQQSEWPATFLGKPLSGKIAPCPVCYANVPIEFGQVHYNKEHEDL